MPCWQLWGEAHSADADAVRVAPAGGVVVRRVPRVDGGLGDPGPRPGVHRGQARGDLLGPVRAQGPVRARRLGGDGGPRGARGGRPRDDADGRCAVRVRLGRARADASPSGSPSTTSSSSRRRSGRTTSTATPRLTAASPVPIAARRVAVLAARVRAADRALGRERRPAGHRPGGRVHRGAAGVRHGRRTPGCRSCRTPGRPGISVAAAAHLATVTPHMPFFEFLPAELCESRLRKELTVDELVFRDGRARDPGAARASASSSTATRSRSSRRPPPVSPELRAVQVADALDAIGLRHQALGGLTRFAGSGTIDRAGLHDGSARRPASRGRRALRRPAGGARRRRPRRGGGGCERPVRTRPPSGASCSRRPVWHAAPSAP